MTMNEQNDVESFQLDDATLIRSRKLNVPASPHPLEQLCILRMKKSRYMSREKERVAHVMMRSVTKTMFGAIKSEQAPTRHVCDVALSLTNAEFIAESEIELFRVCTLCSLAVFTLFCHKWVCFLLLLAREHFQGQILLCTYCFVHIHS